MPQVSYLGLFPFCVTPTDDANLVGDGTWYPLAFTKEEVCALYWKNKSYNVSVTDNGSITYGGTETIPWDSAATDVARSDAFIDPNEFSPTIETDFICADVVSKTIFWSNYELSIGQFTLFGYERFNIFGFSLTTNCYYYNNQYYPLIRFVGPFGYVSTSDFAIKRGWTQAQVDLISVTATCTFLGKPVKLYWEGRYAPSIQDPEDPENTLYVTGGTAGGSWVITLNEQWPYNP